MAVWRQGIDVSLTFSKLVEAIAAADTTLLRHALRAVNIGLTLRNWLIGYWIAEFELKGADRATYGDKLFAELSNALRHINISNSGKRQLYLYLMFYRAYPQIVRTLSAQSNHLLPQESLDEKMRTLSAQTAESDSITAEKLIERLSYSHFEEIVKLDEQTKRRFYETETLRGNWSVRQLRRQIATQYYERADLSIDKQALSDTTHARTEAQALQHIIRDPYIFEFLGLKPQEIMGESHLEDVLIDKLQTFLLELGHGFCFEARQKRLLMGGEHTFINRLFYHRILKCHAPLGLLPSRRKNRDRAQDAGAGTNNTLCASRHRMHRPDSHEIANCMPHARQAQHHSPEESRPC